MNAALHALLHAVVHVAGGIYLVAGLALVLRKGYRLFRRRRVSIAGPFDTRPVVKVTRPMAEAETPVGRFEMDLN